MKSFSAHLSLAAIATLWLVGPLGCQAKALPEGLIPNPNVILTPPGDNGAGHVTAPALVLTFGQTTLPADALTATTVTVTVLNAQGAGVAAQPVHLELSGTRNLLATRSGTTAADGTFHTSLASAAPDVKTLTATSGALSASATLTFVETPACYGTPLLPSVPYPGTGAAPLAGAIADFDGDGHLDLVTANNGGTAVSLLSGRGDGSFSGPVAFPADANAVAIVAADFNQDGFVDLATAHLEPQTLNVLLGDGAGHLAAPVQLPTTGNPNGLVATDVDSDGHLDLVFTLADQNSLGILTGDGHGGFGSTIALVPVTGSTPTAVWAADFNGDHHVDLVTAHFGAPAGDNIAVLLGLGDGAFQAAQLTASGSALIAALAVADLTQDGHPDLIAGTPSGLQVYVGDGLGGLAAPVVYPPPAALISSAGNFTALTVADVNQDGHPDVLALYGAFRQQSARFVLWTGDAHGVLTLTPTAYVQGAQPTWVGTADFDGDAKLDVVATDYTANTAYVQLQSSGGLFDAPSAVLEPGPLATMAAAHIRLIAVADLNGDHLGDFITNWGDAAGPTSVLLTGPTGQLTLGAQVPVGANMADAQVADLNGDGHPDLVVANAHATVSTLLGDGAGGWHAAVDSNTLSVPSSLAIADFNNDGRPDLLAAANGNHDASLLFGVGDGTWQAAVPLAGSGSVGNAVFGDFNGDGHRDIALTAQTSANVNLFFGAGDGTFGAAVRALGTDLAQTVIQQLLVDDFNQDGRPDLLLVTATNPTAAGTGLLLLLGGPQGQLVAGAPFGSFGVNTLGPAAVGDLNGDGMADIAVANLWNGKNSAFFGHGDGTFAPSVDFNSGGRTPNAIAIGDVTGSGQRSLVALSTAALSAPAQISVLGRAGCLPLPPTPFERKGCAALHPEVVWPLLALALPLRRRRKLPQP